MPNVKALAAKSIKSSALTEDGKAIVIDFEVPSGEAAVAIPVSEGPNLVRMLVTLIARSERESKKDPNAKFAVEANYWEVGTAADGDIVITFVLPNSVEQSFKLPKAHGPDLARALSAPAKR